MKKRKKVDSENLINSPSHYSYGSIEPIDVIEDWNLNYHLGSLLKYLARAGHKGGPETLLLDLKKGRWFLNRYIEKLEKHKNK